MSVVAKTRTRVEGQNVGVGVVGEMKGREYLSPSVVWGTCRRDVSKPFCGYGPWHVPPHVDGAWWMGHVTSAHQIISTSYSSILDDCLRLLDSFIHMQGASVIAVDGGRQVAPYKKGRLRKRVLECSYARGHQSLRRIIIFFISCYRCKQRNK